MKTLVMAAAQRSQTFTGLISDEVCSKGNHSEMRMGSTDAECAMACVSAHGAEYVLFDGKNVYRLSGRQSLEQFAAQKVSVVGVLDPKTQTIRVDSIALAK
jgi:hypothetical protein